MQINLLAVDQSPVRTVLADDESSGCRYEGFRYSRQTTSDFVHDASCSRGVNHEGVIRLVANPLQARHCVPWNVVLVWQYQLHKNLAQYRVFRRLLKDINTDVEHWVSAHFTLCTLHITLYTVHITHYTLHFTLVS